jgi:hypothetical protein
MTSPIVPVALFAALVLSVAAAVPLSAAGSGFALVSIAGFMAAMGALAWFVLRADREADPRRSLMRAADRFEERWAGFERDFWAHVAAHKSATRD